LSDAKPGGSRAAGRTLSDFARLKLGLCARLGAVLRVLLASAQAFMDEELEQTSVIAWKVGIRFEQ
jgi:hypothetical protein